MSAVKRGVSTKRSTAAEVYASGVLSASGSPSHLDSDVSGVPP